MDPNTMMWNNHGRINTVHLNNRNQEHIKLLCKQYT